jgi:predicted nucleic acid-binding protein
VGVIFDTSIWVGLASAQLNRQAVVEATGDAPVFTSVITLGELAFGVQSCADPAKRALRAAYLRQVEARPVLDISRHTAAAFGVLSASMKQAGRSPRPRVNDLWIAAQAIEHNYLLLTSNSADFDNLPGLRLASLRPNRPDY